MAIIAVTPTALHEAKSVIGGTEFTHHEILLHLRRDSFEKSDLSMFEDAYKDHMSVWELPRDWRNGIAEDLRKFRSGQYLPLYIKDRVIGIMGAGK